MEEEFQNIKRLMLEKIPLTPMDVSKETHIHRRNSPVELKLLAIVTMASRLDYYTSRACIVRVYTNYSARKGLFSKSISDICNPRLQRMLDSIAGYIIVSTTVCGETHFIVDGLSRNPLGEKLARTSLQVG